MADQDRERLTRLLPAIGGGASGAALALAALIMPGVWLEGVASGSGLAGLIPAAAPPLGFTARAVLALGGGVVTAAIVWAALYLLVGPGGPLAPRRRVDGVPSVRRADAHPDAPPRRPFSIAEMGTEVTAEPEPEPEPEHQPAPIGPAVPLLARDIPPNLDTPLAALDPAAIPAAPMPPVRVLTPLAPGERLDTFKLAPRAPRQTVPSEPPSIEALLRRLEEGAERRLARTG